MVYKGQEYHGAYRLTEKGLHHTMQDNDLKSLIFKGIQKEHPQFWSVAKNLNRQTVQALFLLEEEGLIEHQSKAVDDFYIGLEAEQDTDTSVPREIFDPRPSAPEGLVYLGLGESYSEGLARRRRQRKYSPKETLDYPEVTRWDLLTDDKIRDN